MAVKLSLTQHYHFILICAVSRREGDDAIATMSLKRRFIMSEKGRMINIICIIIFFILSHLSPSPDPRHGVRQGGLSSGQPVTSGSVWRAKPGGWQVEGGQSSSLLPSLHQASPPWNGWVFLKGDGSRLPAFPKGRQLHLGLLGTRLPFGKRTYLRSLALFEVDQVKMCPETTQEWGHPAPMRHCWQD